MGSTTNKFTRVVHLVNCDWVNAQTGYTELIENVIVPAQRKALEFSEVVVVNVNTLLETLHKANAALSPNPPCVFEATLGCLMPEDYPDAKQAETDGFEYLREFRQEFCTRLLALTLGMDRFDIDHARTLMNDINVEVVLHSPVCVVPEYLQQLKALGSHYRVVLHDSGPWLAHNGFWNMKCYDMLDFAKNFGYLLSEYTQARKNKDWETMISAYNSGTELYQDNCMFAFYETLFGIELVPGDRLRYFNYLAQLLEEWNSSAEYVVAPSKLILDIFSSLGLTLCEKGGPLVLHQHPLTPVTKGDKLCALGDKSAALRVVSIFMWEKFDWALYLQVVRTNPQHHFYLITGSRALESYVLPLKTGYGLPANLHLVEYTSDAAQYTSNMKDVAPHVFMHFSMISESYGLILDEMHSWGIPCLLVSNHSALTERLIPKCDVHIPCAELYSEDTGVTPAIVAISKALAEFKDINDLGLVADRLKAQLDGSLKDYRGCSVDYYITELMKYR